MEAHLSAHSEYANEIDNSKQEPLPHMFEWIEMEIAKNREEYRY